MRGLILGSAGASGQKTGQGVQFASCSFSFTSSRSFASSASMRFSTSSGLGSIWSVTKAETVSSSHSRSEKHISLAVRIQATTFYGHHDMLPFRYSTLLSVRKQTAPMVVPAASFGPVDPTKPWKPNRICLPKESPHKII
jgi:hypothetical protein